jgi:hypothetical protein
MILRVLVLWDFALCSRVNWSTLFKWSHFLGLWDVQSSAGTPQPWRRRRNGPARWYNLLTLLHSVTPQKTKSLDITFPVILQCPFWTSCTCEDNWPVQYMAVWSYYILWPFERTECSSMFASTSLPISRQTDKCISSHCLYWVILWKLMVLKWSNCGKSDWMLLLQWKGYTLVNTQITSHFMQMSVFICTPFLKILKLSRILCRR